MGGTSKKAAHKGVGRALRRQQAPGRAVTFAQQKLERRKGRGVLRGRAPGINVPEGHQGASRRPAGPGICRQANTERR